jgi:hypothetical protein
MSSVEAFRRRDHSGSALVFESVAVSDQLCVSYSSEGGTVAMRDGCPVIIQLSIGIGGRRRPTVLDQKIKHWSFDRQGVKWVGSAKTWLARKA